MKKAILVGIFSLALQSQSRLICWPFLAVAVFNAEKTDDSRKWGFAFLLGILSDLLSGRLLGESAILFISMLLVLDLLKLRFKSSWKLNLGVAMFFQLVYLFLVFYFNF